MIKKKINPFPLDTDPEEYEEYYEKQRKKLVCGSRYVKLVRPAILHDGIIRPGENEINYYLSVFSEAEKSKMIKFIPASGAASRMFSFLLKEDLNRENKDIQIFIEGLKAEKFAFTNDLSDVMSGDGMSLEETLNNNNMEIIKQYLLGKKGLNYGSVPKGLIKFHKYPDSGITPLEEHIYEAQRFLGPDKFDIHLTVGKEYKMEFAAASKKFGEKFKRNNIRFEISFSCQNHSTDTISIDHQGNPARNEDGSLHLRPGGHGSLIENLNSLGSDIIFIKNIDNITTRDRINITVKFKKLLGGILIETAEKISSYLKIIPKLKNDSEAIHNIYCYAKDILNIDPGNDFNTFEIEKKKELLFRMLNRPIRVCGMVENRGEPGGGPFWIKKDGKTSLQIVETSQIDPNDPDQQKILAGSKFFNPVDIACKTTDFKGEKFNLFNFSDPDKYIVTEKTLRGEKIRVLEHPGLWNGMMDEWISIFVEVPIETFNPVKSVNDLLKENHIPQPGSRFYDK